jgi:hypothetical protein
MERIDKQPPAFEFSTPRAVPSLWRVIVKFHDEVELPYEDGAEKYVQEYRIGPWADLAKMFPGITLNRVYTSVSPADILELVAQATKITPDYRPPNFLTCFSIDVPLEAEADALAKTLAKDWKAVQYAYVESPPAPPPAVNPPGNNPLTWGPHGQLYLEPAPLGIDAKFAWTVPGGDGTGIKFIDIEKGWTLDHEDLVAAGITLFWGVNQEEFSHGTSVLGIVVAADNEVGVVGIAPKAIANVVSSWPTLTSLKENIFAAVMFALHRLNFGDVLLLEVQFYYGSDPNKVLVPVEIDPLICAQIQLATALGIVVIEAAGNGGIDLDTFIVGGKQILNRDNHADFKDSGAIVVGAATSTYPHSRLLPSPSKPHLLPSNYGSRVDCYAWGEKVATTANNSLTDKTSYTTNFAGTSAASAIIAGAAIVVQSIADAGKVPRKGRLSPLKLRLIFSNSWYGTRSANPAVDRIGVMPNLNRIISGVTGSGFAGLLARLLGFI